MIKFLLTFLVSLIFIATNAYSSLITGDLAQNTYVEYGGYDWTWASPVNVQYFDGENPDTLEWDTNELFGPADLDRIGWMYIQGSELESLFSTLPLHLFQSNDGIINSVAYWNSVFTHVDENNFGLKSSLWVGQNSLNMFKQYETFYVRASVTEVPEPTTLLIFALGLLGLGLRKRLQ